MHKNPDNCQKRMAELEAANRLLQSQLAAALKARQQTSQELQSVRQQLKTLQTPLLEQSSYLVLDNMPEAAFWKDRNSVYLGCNQQFSKAAGLASPGEIIGKTDFDLPWKPEETEWFRACDRRVMESDSPELGIIETLRQADGSQYWLETNKIPLHNSQGSVVGILGTFREITARIEAERQLKQLNEKLELRVEARTQELRTSKARLQRLTDNLPGLIFQFRIEADGTRSFPYVSEGCRDIYELEPDNFLRCCRLIHPSDSDGLEQALQDSAVALSGLHHEHRIITPSGKLKWVQTIARPEKEADGAILWDGLMIEISDRKKAEQALVASTEKIRQQAQREQLLNQIANQIRTSLDLEQILDTTVKEIQSFLEVDRCHFAWYVETADEFYWDVITEVQRVNLPSFIGQHAAASFGSLTARLLNQEIFRLDNVETIDDEAAKAVLSELGNKSMLVLPVQAECGQVGIISCIHHQVVRPWLDDELDLLKAVVAQLEIALHQGHLLAQSQARAQELEILLDQLQKAQSQLVQNEKMSSLGQMVAGVAHEINNPVSFIYGNLTHAKNYTQDLIRLIDEYQHHHPKAHPAIRTTIDNIELEFLRQDLPKLFQSMEAGTERIREIIKSLRMFSRLDEADIRLNRK